MNSSTFITVVWCSHYNLNKHCVSYQSISLSAVETGTQVPQVSSPWCSTSSKKLQIKLNSHSYLIQLQLLIPYFYKYYNRWAWKRGSVSIHLPPCSRTRSMLRDHSYTWRYSKEPGKHQVQSLRKILIKYTMKFNSLRKLFFFFFLNATGNGKRKEKHP